MPWWDYLLIVATIPLYGFFGKLVLRFSSFMANALGVLMLAGGVGEIIIRTAPCFLRPFYLIVLSIGFISLMVDIRKNSRRSLNRAFARQYASILSISILAAAVLFGFFHFENYAFESHQVLYLDAVLEAFRADYFGNVRVSSYYPFERAALHLTPAAFLGAPAALITHLTLAHLIEVKYILICFFFGSFFQRAMMSGNFESALNRLILSRIIQIVLILMIFGNFFNYTLYISSFCYTFILCHLILLFREGADKTEEFLFFAVALLLTKTTIIPATLVFIAYVAATIAVKASWKTLVSSKVIAIFLLFLINALIWRATPQGVDKISSFYFEFPKTFEALSGLGALTDPSTNLIEDPRWKLIWGVFGFVYAMYFLVVVLPRKERPFTVWDAYMLISLLALLFLRTDGGLTHIRHTYYFAGVMLAFILIANPPRGMVWNAGLLSVGLFFWMGTHQKYYFVPFYHLTTSDIPGYHFLSYREFRHSEAYSLQGSGQTFYVPPAGETYWKTELFSSLLGMRVRSNLVTPDYGQNMLWIIRQ